MKYIRLKSTDPYYNLAVEEYLFRTASEDVFMLWQNEPSVIAGKNQNLYAEVYLDYAKEQGINLCRRITGGGAVYHDLGNLNYTFISVSGQKALDFEYFTRPIRKALSDLGVNAEIGGRNDIECNGCKISGNAQYSEGERILHHGTLLFDTDFSVMESVLRVDKEKLAARAVKSCRARVANLKELLPTPISQSEFFEMLESAISSSLGALQAPPPENGEISALAERNRSQEWIFSDRRYLTEYSISRKRKYPFGILSLDVDFCGEVVHRVKFSGDFFSKKPIEELERALVGKSPLRDALPDPAPYIHGMTSADLLAILTNS